MSTGSMVGAGSSKQGMRPHNLCRCVRCPWSGVYSDCQASRAALVPNTLRLRVPSCCVKEASLLAMGAYGRSTLREFFGGSVTRSML